eukprot:SAG31_NODE_25061_length_468_cov_4.436314_1_plen_56_part_01
MIADKTLMASRARCEASAVDRGSAMRRRLVGPEAELVLQVRRSPGMGRGLYTLNPI